jgi:hypothetical protein
MLIIFYQIKKNAYYLLQFTKHTQGKDALNGKMICKFNLRGKHIMLF